MEELRIVLALEPDNPKAHFYLGAAYEGLDKLDLAEKEYLAVLSQTPDDMNTVLRLAQLYQNNGRAGKGRDPADQDPREGPG